MSFEDNFPEFKNHKYMYFAWDGRKQFNAVPAIHQRDIIKNCLSKQKVKDAILKISERSNNMWTDKQIQTSC